MVTFVPSFVTDARRRWVEAGEVGEPPEVTPADVADHCDRMRERVGIDHVGLGGDLCGTDTMPTGLDDASTYPALLTELAGRGWSEADLRKLGSENVLRALEAHDDRHRATTAAH